MPQPSHPTMVFLQKESQPATVHQGINSVKPKQSVYLPILFPRDKRSESTTWAPWKYEQTMDELQTARSGGRSFTNQEKYFVLIIQGVSKSMFSIFCRYMVRLVPPLIHGWFIDTDLGQRQRPTNPQVSANSQRCANIRVQKRWDILIFTTLCIGI